MIGTLCAFIKKEEQRLSAIHYRNPKTKARDRLSEKKKKLKKGFPRSVSRKFPLGFCTLTAVPYDISRYSRSIGYCAVYTINRKKKKGSIRNMAYREQRHSFRLSPRLLGIRCYYFPLPPAPHHPILIYKKG